MSFELQQIHVFNIIATIKRRIVVTQRDTPVVRPTERNQCFLL